MSSTSPTRDHQKGQPPALSFKDETYSVHRVESQLLQDRQREIALLKNQNTLLEERLRQAEATISKLVRGGGGVS